MLVNSNWIRDTWINRDFYSTRTGFGHKKYSIFRNSNAQGPGTVAPFALPWGRHLHKSAVNAITTHKCIFKYCTSSPPNKIQFSAPRTYDFVHGRRTSPIGKSVDKNDSAQKRRKRVPSVLLYDSPNFERYIASVVDDWKMSVSNGEMIITEETKVLLQKTVPVPLCPPQIPHSLARNRFRSSVVTGRQLTTWSNAGQGVRSADYIHCK
jgi:hypothetical protein